MYWHFLTKSSTEKLLQKFFIFNGNASNLWTRQLNYLSEQERPCRMFLKSPDFNMSWHHPAHGMVAIFKNHEKRVQKFLSKKGEPCKFWHAVLVDLPTAHTSTIKICWEWHHSINISLHASRPDSHYCLPVSPMRLQMKSSLSISIYDRLHISLLANISKNFDLPLSN